MSKTVGYHWPHKSTKGDYSTWCDYCGAKFRRSQLVRLANGFLACIDNDAIGRDEVTLDRLNAQAATRFRPRYQRTGGRGW